jgi:hypothetical protein
MVSANKKWKETKGRTSQKKKREGLKGGSPKG